MKYFSQHKILLDDNPKQLVEKYHEVWLVNLKFLYDFGCVQFARNGKTRNAYTTSGAYCWQATVKPNIKGVE